MKRSAFSTLTQIPIPKELRKQSLEAFAFARSALYSTEGLVGPAIEMVTKFRRPRLKSDDPKLFQSARASIFELLRRDVANITAGYYPAEVLMPESPIKHLLRMPVLPDIYLCAAP